MIIKRRRARRAEPGFDARGRPGIILLVIARTESSQGTARAGINWIINAPESYAVIFVGGCAAGQIERADQPERVTASAAQVHAAVFMPQNRFILQTRVSNYQLRALAQRRTASQILILTRHIHSPLTHPCAGNCLSPADLLSQLSVER